MNRIITAAVFAATLATPTFAGALDVTVRNVTAGTGEVSIALFDEAGFASQQPAGAQSVPADAAELVIRFENVPAGTYGIRMYQDLDGNGMLDRGAMSRPVEPYGFSNDAPVRFGPPMFEDIAFETEGEESAITITLR